MEDKPVRFRIEADGNVCRNARLEIVLRLEVAFVEEIVHREICVNPMAQALVDAEVNHVQAGRPNRRVFAVQAIVADVAIFERAVEAAKVRERNSGVADSVRRAVRIDSGRRASTLR